MANIKRLLPGQVLYTVGSTTLSRLAVHPIRVIEVLPDGKGVLASWNGNAPRRFAAAAVAGWRVNKPKQTN